METNQVVFVKLILTSEITLAKLNEDNHQQREEHVTSLPPDILRKEHGNYTTKH